MAKNTLVAHLTGLLLLFSPLAEAHFGAFPEAMNVSVAADPGSDAIALEASFGLLLDNNTGGYHWLCHESIINIGATVMPRYSMNSDGVILGTTGVLSSSRNTTETLYRTTDGCDWVTTTGLTEKVVTDTAFSPINSQRAIASTATLEFGVVNGLYYSDDAGVTWQASDTTSDERLFRNVHFGDDGTAWATASYFNPLSSWLYRSDDGGLTWQEMEIFYEAKGSRQVLLDVLVATGSGPQVWLRIDAPIMDRLLYSSDGGNNFTEIFEVTTELKVGTRTAEGKVWLVDAYGRLLTDGGSGDILPLEESPSVSGVTSDSRGVFVSTRVQDEKFALLLTQDGVTYQELFRLEDTLPPPNCAPESHSVQRCEPYWDTLHASLLGDDDDSAGDDDDSAGDDDSIGDDDTAGDDDDSGPGGGASGCCGENEEESLGSSMAFLALLLSLGSLRRRSPPC